MLKFISIFLLVFSFTIQMYGQTATLEVEVTNIQSIKGNLKMGVFDKVHEYRTKSNPFMRARKIVTDSVEDFIFEKVPLGRYAVAVYHDENNDDTLNVKALGIPIEGVGFSGKFNSRIKPPDYPLASFRLKSDTIISIRLIYNKRD